MSKKILFIFVSGFFAFTHGGMATQDWSMEKALLKELGGYEDTQENLGRAGKVIEGINRVSLDKITLQEKRKLFEAADDRSAFNAILKEASDRAEAVQTVTRKKKTTPAQRVEREIDAFGRAVVSDVEKLSKTKEGKEAVKIAEGFGKAVAKDVKNLARTKEGKAFKRFFGGILR
jgi:hypothetical protein